jgi:hypothetical protein
MKKILLSGNKHFHYLSLIALVLFPLLKGSAQVSLATLGAAYTQNFNTLVNTGTGSTVPTGWAFVESPVNTVYTAGTGSTNGGDTYSFGASSASDRAFGTLRSGSVGSTIGASFTNNTGSIITSLDISYIGEEWRLGVAGRTDELDFEYSLNATSLTTGTWNSVAALNFITPNTSAPVNAKDGNTTGNRTALNSTISSLVILNGATIWIRWTDLDIAGSEDGLAIDDFSLTPNGGTPVPPTHLAVTNITPTSPIAGNGFSVVVQSQDISNTAKNVLSTTGFTLSTNGNAGAIGGIITGSIPAGVNTVTVTGVTLATAGTGVNVTATRTSGDVLSAGTSANFIVIGNATHLVLVTPPSSGFVSTNLSGFTIEARRADNSVDGNYSGSIVVSKASGPGSLSGTTIVSAVAGIATFNSLQFDQAGVYTLNATSGTLTPASSTNITIAPTPVTWNFTTAAPSGGIPVANLTISSMSPGNNNGTTNPFIDATAPSSGYTGASASNNAGAAARTGALNTGANGSAYFEFTLTPTANHYVNLNGISFGNRSTGTGPQAYSLRSSKDNYASNLASGAISGTAWALKTHTITPTSSTAGNPITFRIYGHTGVGSPGANVVNWRIDDVILNLDVQQCVSPTINVNSGSICPGNSFTITPTGGVSYTITGNTFTVNPSISTNYTVTGADNIGCENTAVSSVVINTLPTISASANPATICIGSSSTLSANGGVSYVWDNGATTASIVSNPTVTTSYTVTGTDGNGCSNTGSVTLNVINCVGTTSLTPASCGTTVASLGDFLYFHAVQGATNYKVELVNAQQSYSVVNIRNRNVPDFKLSWIPGTQYGSTYAIRVSAYVAGAWRPWGPACNVTSSSTIPTTNFSAGSCGITLGSLDQTLNFDEVSGATNYRFEITSASQPLNVVNVRNNTVLNFKMSWITNLGVQYNQTYDVKIGAMVNGVWQPYGAACQITTPATPTSSLVPSACDAVVGSLSQIVNFTTIPGATNYKVLVTNATQSLSAVNIRNNTQATFALSYIPNTAMNVPYNISISAYVGGVWGSYGTVCKLTAGGAARFASEDTHTLTLENEEALIGVYPNPNKGEFIINLASNRHVDITNVLGETIMSQLLPEGHNTVNINEQPAGIYFVKVIQNGKMTVVKIIKE